jgi:hypothetical protein
VGHRWDDDRRRIGRGGELLRTARTRPHRRLASPARLAAPRHPRRVRDDIGARVAAASTQSTAARRFARANAIGAIAASIAGNATFHAARTGLLLVSWPIVVLVGAVPAAVLGLTAHLHALRGRTEAGTPDIAEAANDEPPRRPHRKHRPRHRSADELIAAARTADARHREANGGRPITRDALRTTLRVSNARATQLRQQLTQEGTTHEQADV